MNEIVEILIDFSIDVNIIDKNGLTPLDYVNMPRTRAINNVNIRKLNNIIEILLDAGGLSGAELTKRNIAQQSVSLMSSMNPRLGYDSPLGYLDQDTMNKMKDMISSYNPKKNSWSTRIRKNNEIRRDKLTKAKQRLSMARLHIADDLTEKIAENFSRHRPIPSVHRKMDVEDENLRMADYVNYLDQYGSGFSKR